METRQTAKQRGQVTREAGVRRAVVVGLALLLAGVAGAPAVYPAEAEKGAIAEYPAGHRFRDCADCPEMVVVPAGSFLMGSPASEESRHPDEGPQHRVTIPAPLAVGRYEVTRGEFERFVKATGYSAGDACWTYESHGGQPRSGRHWREPGFAQTAQDPVVCVGWEDAQEYVAWLSRETGYAYRLLSEAEWEYVARAGTTTAWYWGEREADRCHYENGTDEGAIRHGRGWTEAECDDGYDRTAPVGSFEANAFGLSDMLGNVEEWVEDCGNDSYEGAPSDGRAWASGECGLRVRRGGSWLDIPRFLRSTERSRFSPSSRSSYVGFRVARTLTP